MQIWLVKSSFSWLHRFMADCFIIMPISTPDFFVPTYANDKDHFQHVLECLFIPAVKKAGLNPIPPAAKGADIIHAGIIQNLETADIVLCDMSSLNANLFFELGVRTAIGKPVCVVKDDATPKVPFDMTVVNYHTYTSALSSWTLDKEVENLAAHLKSSLDLSAGENLLWKYFSLSQRAHLTPSNSKDETQDRLALLSAQVEGLSKKLDNVRQPTIVYTPHPSAQAALEIDAMRDLGKNLDNIRQPTVVYTPNPSAHAAMGMDAMRDLVLRNLHMYAIGKALIIVNVKYSPFSNELGISTAGQPDEAAISQMTEIAAALGFVLNFAVAPAQPVMAVN